MLGHIFNIFYSYKQKKYRRKWKDVNKDTSPENLYGNYYTLHDPPIIEADPPKKRFSFKFNIFNIFQKKKTDKKSSN